MKNIFDLNVTQEVINRIQNLKPDSRPIWGKMSVGQMLAHCSKPYETVYDPNFPKPGAIGRFFAKVFAKGIVTSEKPYKRSSPTAPEFKINETRDFESEKKRLIDFIQKTQQLGASHFDGKQSLSFGPLSVAQWNNLFYKHLDHHLNQFGV